MRGGGLDSATIAAAADGEDVAWHAIYTALAGPVLGYLRAQQARDPDDLLGEVFVHLARRIGDFSGSPAGFRSWVFTIAHSRLIDERRYWSRRPIEPVADVPDPPAHGGTEQLVMRRAATERVIDLLSLLTDDQRDVLLLRLVGGLTIAEVAEAVGKRQGAVKALQRRGLARLARLTET